MALILPRRKIIIVLTILTLTPMPKSSDVSILGVLRYENLLGDFYFWSASTGASVLQGVCSAITHTCPQILIENELKGVGFSIRCIKKE